MAIERLTDILSGATPDREALICNDGLYTYGELEALSNQVAHLLLGWGAKASDTICQVVGNRSDLVFNLFGILKTGATYAPLNPALSEREFAALLADCRPSIVIADDPLTGTLERAAATVSRCRVCPAGEVSRLASGTTGRSKGVQLSHRKILTNARQVIARMGVGPEDRLLIVMPIFHVNAFSNQVVLPLLAGASIVLRARFVADDFWTEVAQYRPTYFTAVPTILSRLLDAPHAPSTSERSSLRFVRSGAAPLSQELQRRFEARFGLAIVASYGMTEATCTVTMNPPAQRRPGSVGTALDGIELRILGPGDVDQPQGEVGEIAIRGPTLMLGYLGLPEETREAIPDGWLRSGDLGYLDQDGYLFLTDRKKDLVIRGGENISPREIEEVLCAHPMVAEAAVIGAPDRDRGEQVVAFVVLCDRTRPWASVSAELLEHRRANLARYKVPSRMEELAAMPKNAVGKITKQALKDARP